MKPGAQRDQTTSSGNADSGPVVSLRVRSIRVLSAILILLGLAVIAGWLLQIAALTTLLPGLASMVLQTAICFVLCGCALGASVGKLRLQRLAWLPAAIVLLLALLNWMALHLGIASGMELAGLQRWNHDGNPYPGQMAEATTLSFALAAIALLLQPLRRQPRADLAIRVLALAVFAIGLAAIVGYALRVELLYSWYALGRMALHTALGMCLLAVALWLSREFSGTELLQERQILLVGVLSLIAVALVSGLTGVAVFRLEAETALGKSLRVARDARTDLLSTMLQLRATRASIVNTRPELIGLLRRLVQNPDDRLARQSAQQMIESFAPYGFSSIELLSADGHPLAASGSAVTDATMAVPVETGVAGEHRLVWRQGFLLRSSYRVSDADGVVGSLITEQPLPTLYQALTSAEDLGASAEIMLCSANPEGRRCFPNHTQTQPFEIAADDTQTADLLSAAARGASAVGIVRVGRSNELIAYGPAKETGLISAIRVDAAELYAPIRRGLFWGFLLIGSVTLFAALLLRALIRPLARELAVAEGHNHTVIESLGEGILLFDSSGTVLAANGAAERQFGALRSQLQGRTFHEDWGVHREDGSPMPAAEYPTAIVLRTGVAQKDVILNIPRANGELRCVSASFVPVAALPGRHDHGVVVSIRDITEQRRAEALSRQLEQRFRLLVDSVADHAILMLDTQGRIVSWNAGAEMMKGYRAEEILGRHFSCFYPPEDIAAQKTEQELEIARSKGHYAEEGWRLRKNGSRFWASVVISAIHDERDVLVGFAKVSRDLSERRLAERKLAEAFSFQRAVLDSAPYAIIASGTDFKCTVFNPAAERMLWYSEEEVLGKVVPAMVHDLREVESRAEELSQELGRPVEPGPEVFVCKSRAGISEEREWTYIRKDGSRFPVNLAVTEMRDETGQPTGYLGIAYDITDRKRREDYTRHVAHHDFLTGLPNRMLMHDRLAMALERAKRAGEKVAVLLLDLDHFKRVNDSLGHHIGDELLKAVAERIQACVRSVDTVARMGGDEFVIVLGQISNVFDVERIATSIVDKVSAPMQIGSHELVVSPSIGISCYPDDGADGNHLLKNADSAMYRAKESGRQGYCLFNSEMSRLAQEKLDLENAIHRALRDDGFKLHYQPQICLQSGDVLGMEALLRWNDPVLGTINPDRFIPVAESSGLIVPLGEWVLRTACREARALQQRTGHALKLAVNLSARQFRHPALATQIREALNSSGLPADSLEVEVTEGMLMSQTEETLARLREIRALGVTIAIDDFGIGFSSLSYITRFPIDTLKIDRSFIRNLPDSINDAAVAQAIIALAASLQIKVVAEGVETRGQLDFLRLRSCDAAQGFYLGQPVPAGNFSVQGFCFSKALSVEDFVASFEELQKLGARSVIDLLH